MVFHIQNIFADGAKIESVAILGAGGGDDRGILFVAGSRECLQSQENFPTAVAATAGGVAILRAGGGFCTCFHNVVP